MTPSRVCIPLAKSYPWAMKQIILPVATLLPLLFMACGPQTNRAPSGIGNTTEAPLPSHKITVSGLVTQTDSHCGGVAPTDEMEKRLATPHAFPGKKFHVIKGDTNTTAHEIVLSFATGEDGNFSFQLLPGTYSILVDEQATPPDAKKYRTEFISLDEACYDKWWAKPYHLLEVKTADLTGLKFHFHHRCFLTNDIPCLRYTGPYPP